MFSEFRCSASCPRGVVIGTEPLPVCPPECFQYKGTLDVFFKVVRQVSDNVLAFFLFFLQYVRV